MSLKEFRTKIDKMEIQVYLIMFSKFFKPWFDGFWNIITEVFINWNTEDKNVIYSEIRGLCIRKNMANFKAFFSRKTTLYHHMLSCPHE